MRRNENFMMLHTALGSRNRFPIPADVPNGPMCYPFLGEIAHLHGAKPLGHPQVWIGAGSNRHMAVARLAKILIAPEVGPEVLTGSTRLKGGTAQKMVLNMLSTAVMASLGHVYENLMIDAVLTNEKLADRALRILAEASGKSVSAAEHAFRAAGHDLRVGLVMLKLRITAAEAKKRLKVVRGDLRKAMGD